MLQLAEFHANALVSVKPKKPSLKERKQKLLAFLQGAHLLLPFCVQLFNFMSLPDEVLIVITVLQTVFSDREV